MVKTQSLLKCVSMYLCYFLYTYFGNALLQKFTEVNRTTMMFILDIFFLVFIGFIYFNNLKNDWNNIRKNYNFKKILKVIVLGFLSVVILNIVISFVINILFPNATIEGNTKAIYDIASLSSIYAIFKTMIFGVFAEELLFRESLSECVSNNIIFVILSSLIYAGMNFVFTNLSGINLIVQVMIYFCGALIFSTIYIKNDRNILLVMAIKFIYNLIPLMLLLVA